MNATTKVSDRVIATIKLDGEQGRGELFARDGDIWCRSVESGQEWPTGIDSAIESEEHAIDTIRLSWDSDGSGVWELEWIEV